MITDIYGYSRLTELDGVTIVDRQIKYTNDCIYLIIQEFSGTLIKNTSDGFIARFYVSHSAINCALSIQNDISLLEETTSEELKIKYRIGLNIGDVLSDVVDLLQCT